ncbi:haloacid dehalogenase type II [Nocardioides hankookensis]|uniref:Haloacid dehalogenase type II n=1 Tax=Nocardioides hankookensis TaxID=443157 RepID=A0ABW1LRK6_9ACTN
MQTSDIRALVFDVLGTVVDENATVERAAAEMFAAAGLPREELPGFLEEWEREQRSRMDAIRTAGAAWTDSDAIRASTLRERIRTRGWDVPEPAIDRLATVGHRLDPWADSVAALERLALQRAVVALTNGSVAQMADTFVHAGLRWTLVLSADQVQTFKPADAMYRLPPAYLQVAPEQMLFVAAHPWDLDAAAEHGYRTALVRRPGTSTEGEDRFGLSVDTIAELADVLSAR